MADKKTTALAKAPSQAILEALRNEFPVEQGYTQNLLPRLGMFSQDQIEGKGKQMKVTTEAGTFFIDRETDEVVDGKKVWEKTELGDTIDAVILFKRKQLRYYNEGTEEYTSSPIYDTEDEVIPLFLDKKEVARDTPANLKARSEFQVTENGKTKSKLEENRILYVLYKDVVYQMNLRGSSMYSYKSYEKTTLPPSVITTFTSEAMEKGDISWNKMIFTVSRELSNDEIIQEVQPRIAEIKQSVSEQKEFFANKAGDKVSDEEAEAGTKAKEGFKKF